MAKKKHQLYDVDLLCARTVAYGKACERRGQAGSGSRLGNFGKKTTERTGLFKSRLGITDPNYQLARKKLGTNGPKPSQQVGYPVQAHHMISKKEYGEDKVFKFAEFAGYDIDNGLNCLLMPVYCGYQMWEELQFHKSGHWPPYFAHIRGALTDVIAGYTDEDACDLDKMKELHEKFHKLEDDLYGLLERGMDLPLYETTAKLYGMDYKDEDGTSFAAGLAWKGARKPHKWYMDNSKKSPRCPAPSVLPGM
jgi:hypothetical protein